MLNNVSVFVLEFVVEEVGEENFAYSNFLFYFSPLPLVDCIRLVSYDGGKRLSSRQNLVTFFVARSDSLEPRLYNFKAPLLER